MKPVKNFAIADRFLIIPNRFVNISGEITAVMINKFSKRQIYWSYLLERLNLGYVLAKIKYKKSKTLFEKKFGFIPMKTVRLKLPKYQSPSAG